MSGIRIKSNNYYGETCNIMFTGLTGNTATVYDVTLPYDFEIDDIYGEYSIYFPSFSKTCTLTVVAE